MVLNIYNITGIAPVSLPLGINWLVKKQFSIDNCLASEYHSSGLPCYSFTVFASDHLVVAGLPIGSGQLGQFALGLNLKRAFGLIRGFLSIQVIYFLCVSNADQITE